MLSANFGPTRPCVAANTPFTPGKPLNQGPISSGRLPKRSDKYKSLSDRPRGELYVD